MRTVEKEYKLRRNSFKFSFDSTEETFEAFLSKSIFLDIELYNYKVPKCIGLFGAGIIDNGYFNSSQYLLERNRDLKSITLKSLEYLKSKEKEGKKYLITFAGNNDILVLDYFFKKYRLNYKVREHFKVIDLQRELEKEKSFIIGLKALENLLKINRGKYDIKGVTIAKIFQKLLKDDDYINRMEQERIENLLIYNRKDYLNLYYILVRWKKLTSKSLGLYVKERSIKKEVKKEVKKVSENEVKKE